MLRITMQSDYGIVLLTRLAQAERGKAMSARDLAKETRVPPPMAGKILKTLARAGILTSERGAKGGYRLARRPEKISVDEIIAALDGPIAITSCSDEKDRSCTLRRLCPVRTNWNLINQEIRQALLRVSLKDMSGTISKKKRARRASVAAS